MDSKYNQSDDVAGVYMHRHGTTTTSRGAVVS